MANWFTRLFEKRSATGGGRINGIETWFQAASLAGVVVTPETAMSLPVVMASVNLIATTVAMSPRSVYQRTDDGKGRIPRTDHPVYDLIQFETNPDLSAEDFWTAIVGHAALYGNGYGYVDRLPNGIPKAIYLLDPNAVQIRVSSSGTLLYDVQQDFLGVSRGSSILSDNIIHIKGLHTHNGVMGVSPVTKCRNAIGCLIAAETYGAAAFGNSATPTLYLSSPNKLNPQAIKTTFDNFNSGHQGPYNAGKLGLLDNGVEIKSIINDLGKLQYLEVREFLDNQVCKIFGVPPMKTGDMNSANYSNLAESNQDFWQTNARIWTNKVSSEIMRKLFTIEERRSLFVEHDLNEIIRDPNKRYDFMSLNEQRLSFGLNSIGERGDQIYMGPNSVPVPVNPEAENSAPPTEEPPLPATSTDATNAVRQVLLERLQSTVVKEVQAIKRAAKRDGFDGFLDGFYQDHRSHFSESLASSLAAYRAVTGTTHHLDLDHLIETSKEELRSSTEVEAILEGWLDTKAERMLQAIGGERA